MGILHIPDACGVPTYLSGKGYILALPMQYISDGSFSIDETALDYIFLLERT